MPTTFPFAAARETATNDGNPPPAADWISIVIVAGGLVALLFVIFLVYVSKYCYMISVSLTLANFSAISRKNTGPRTQPPLTQATDDLEASRISSGADSRTSADRLTIQSLDQISPAKTYKDLKAEGTELPPDQTGPTVDWQVGARHGPKELPTDHHLTASSASKPSRTPRLSVAYHVITSSMTSALAIGSFGVTRHARYVWRSTYRNRTSLRCHRGCSRIPTSSSR